MNENVKYTIASTSDIDGVLVLQEKYLVTNLSETEKKAGFVTTPFTNEQLTEVIVAEGLFLAKDNNEIIGYCFAASWNYFSQWKIFEYMITLFGDYRFDNSEITVDNSFQYGPICVDIPYRGKSVSNGLVEIMRTNMQKEYPIAVTFINKINIPSYKAHTQKLGWSVIADFSFNGNDYYVLAMATLKK